jgi:hypothetical protein
MTLQSKRTKAMKAIVSVLMIAIAIIFDGCQSTGPSADVMALIERTVYDKAVVDFGPESQWTPQQRAIYRSAVAYGQLQAAQKMQAERDQRVAAAAVAAGQGLQAAGQSVAGAQTDPFILYKMNAARRTQDTYRSWHNSDGSSGQYVPYPGGNGGTIYNSDGSVTNIDPAIGH